MDCNHSGVMTMEKVRKTSKTLLNIHCSRVLKLSVNNNHVKYFESYLAWCRKAIF